MRNSFGNMLKITLFGESHGPAVGALLDGLPAGLFISREAIHAELGRRNPHTALSTARKEPDDVEILSGVLNDKSTGSSLCLVIRNKDVRSADYDALNSILRPGHADYASFARYGEASDKRGGGHLSGRLTAPLTAAGAILKQALSQKGIDIATHVLSLGGISDRPFQSLTGETLLQEDFALLSGKSFPVLDPEKEERMRQTVLAAKEAGDSVGGILETAVCGIPAGVGEPWFDSVESMLSHMLFSVPAVKGVEFGLGFGFSGEKGSAVNDAFTLEGGRIRTKTNHNGGINGGITNGMPLLFRTVIKPPSSIAKEQETVDLCRMEQTIVTVRGRHDPSIVPRASAILDCAAALVLSDLLMTRFGENWILPEEEK